MQAFGTIHTHPHPHPHNKNKNNYPNDPSFPAAVHQTSHSTRGHHHHRPTASSSSSSLPLPSLPPRGVKQHNKRIPFVVRRAAKLQRERRELKAARRAFRAELSSLPARSVGVSAGRAGEAAWTGPRGTANLAAEQDSGVLASGSGSGSGSSLGLGLGLGPGQASEAGTGTAHRSRRQRRKAAHEARAAAAAAAAAASDTTTAAAPPDSQAETESLVTEPATALENRVEGATHDTMVMERPSRLLALAASSSFLLRGHGAIINPLLVSQTSAKHTQRPSPPSPRRETALHTPPSRESGGVPDPTPAYLAQAALPPSTLPHPRPLLIILDLNGTLLFRPRSRAPTHFLERPHARSFLRYCATTFRLVVWSSAQPRNVGAMCASLIDADTRASLVAIWSRDRFGLSQKDYFAKTQCYKRLTQLWDDPTIAASHPDASRGAVWDQSNTVLVDDSAEKARAQPHNLVEIPEFTGNDAVFGVDDVLPRVHEFLNTLASQEDVSRYLRLHPFTLAHAAGPEVAAAPMSTLRSGGPSAAQEG